VGALIHVLLAGVAPDALAEGAALPNLYPVARLLVAPPGLPATSQILSRTAQNGPRASFTNVSIPGERSGWRQRKRSFIKLSSTYHTCGPP
jgi:hypothetical protein